MTLSTTRFAADFNVARNDISDAVVFGVQTGTGVMGSAGMGLEAMMAGENGDRQAPLVLVVSEWSPLPAIGDKLTARSIAWRVEDYTDDPMGVTRTYQLTEDNGYG